MRSRSIVAGLAVPTALGVVAYLTMGRRPCLAWGATAEDVERAMPGDELLPDPDILATRAVRIAAPPEAVWPWLVQMGSGKGGLYTYDWIENLLGLNMHSVDEVLPQFQDPQLGDVEQLGKSGPRLRLEVLEPGRAMVWHSEDGNWVWAFGLYAEAGGMTALVSRNRIQTPEAPPLLRAFNTLLMEPGSLVMERKMLLGIKQRAERLARDREGTGEAAS